MIPKTLLLLASAVLTVSCSNSNKSETPSSTVPAPGTGSVVRLDPAFDQLVPKDAAIEKLAGGFQFTEGPLWRPQEKVLWFSDVVGNVVRQWSPDGGVKVLIQKAGGDPGNILPGGFVGPNGEAADQDGYVLICQHTARRIVRVGKNMQMTTLVERYEGKRFNSPNDLVYKSDGSLYFTDPPYGLPKQDEDPTKEIPFNGVYRLKSGRVDAIIKDLIRPNGIAFSPDQKVLYIANSDEKRKIWMRYDVADDGTVKNGRVFFDVTVEKEEGLPDGMKVDSQGNVYGSGPGGIWVFSPDGKHLGTIKPPETPANCNWGEDGKSLYLTARTGLYRIKLAVTGARAIPVKARNEENMKRRTYLKSVLAGASALVTGSTAWDAAVGTGGKIQLHVDLSVDPAKEQEMLHNFKTIFRPAAAKQPGYLDVQMLKLRSALQGSAPTGVNYRFLLTYASEEFRRKWIASETHKKVWPTVEKTLTSTNYTVLLFDVV